MQSEFKINKIDENKLDLIRWDGIEGYELCDVATGEQVEKKAKVKFLYSEKFFYVFFNAEDDHIWGTYKNDDDPIYNEEAVEIFLSFGEETPREYFELQFSPNSVKYDAWVKNPTGIRTDPGFEVDTKFNFRNIKYKVEVEGEGEPKKGLWKVFVKIPADEIKGSNFKKGDILRGNFFRIDGYPKQNSFQALSPNFEIKPNFHTPEKFAKFELI